MNDEQTEEETPGFPDSIRKWRLFQESMSIHGSLRYEFQKAQIDADEFPAIAKAEQQSWELVAHVADLYCSIRMIEAVTGKKLPGL